MASRTMRVMWFTNDPLPAVRSLHGLTSMGSGHWMPSLLERLVLTPDIQIDVVTASSEFRDEQCERGGVNYFVVGQRRFRPFFTGGRGDLEKCIEIVNRRRPDIVHIHGSERFYGLMAARNLISTPCVISLQGLLGPYAGAFFGALSPRDLWRSQGLIEAATRRGLIWRYRDLLLGARQEREILAGVKSFMGRTDWDKAHVRSINATANYYHVGEVLRPAFSDALWDVSQCERHSVIFTNAGEPRRGTEVLLRAMKTVRREFPDATLRLGGQIGARRGYDRFLRRMIEESGLSEAVEFLGYLDATAMVKELRRAHVFAISSYLENSPNSLCEAMQVGVPCVATYAGGMPSLVEQGRTGLLFPTGDSALLAEAIIKMFRDDDFARRLSWSAKCLASERHAPQRVTSQVLEAYNHVLDHTSKLHHSDMVSQV